MLKIIDKILVNRDLFLFNIKDITNKNKENTKKIVSTEKA